MTARDGIVWTQTDGEHWEGRSGPRLVGVVAWHDGYAVRSSDGRVRGQHSTLDSAKAQLESWMRWLDSTDAA